MLLCTVAAVMAFTLSFNALRAVGIASGITPRLAWMFPLTIDTVILFGTWAAFRFRARGAAGTWYAWVLLIVFAAASWTGNFLHAEPVPVGHMELSRLVASLFSSVPSLSLLLTTHMLVLIAVRRGEEREHVPAAEPVAVAVSARANEPDVPARAQIAAAENSDTFSGALVAPVAEPSDTDVEQTAERTDDFAAWVAAQEQAGVRPTGRMAVEAGFAGSEATGRRWLRNLRLQMAHRQEAETWRR
ncbi:DUF2637 domain-containing protein [Isoptericola sp. BMS4]|uniref:DUF2637 domain-containing protein n=1 Tax=Isoptericola sp. BMS4 TaxID=2527875 RepID=UPI001423897D|nr:DUF2637 domain-containing protein [Isoptericola sp. BMS4]